MMFQASQREIYVAGVRHDDLLAMAARARLAAAATGTMPADRVRATGRIRASARRVVASLATLVANF
jgi:hypothetical protein